MLVVPLALDYSVLDSMKERVIELARLRAKQIDNEIDWNDNDPLGGFTILHRIREYRKLLAILEGIC